MISTEQRAKLEQVARELALKLAEEPCGHLSSPSQRKNAIEYYATKFEPVLAAALAACARESQKPALAVLAELREEFAEHDAQYEVYSCLDRIVAALSYHPT